MEVHAALGKGHGEVLYKDALVVEFKAQQIPFSREKQFCVDYKGSVLPHHYFADLLCMTKLS